MTGHMKGMEGMEGNKQEPIIRLEGLGKQFSTANGTVTALEDINLEIKSGEIFGIIGLSGAGKSTLVRCINYLEVPTSGKVIFQDKNLSAMSDKQKRLARQSMGIIFQQFNLLPVLTARENIIMPLLLDKKQPDEVYLNQLTDLLGIRERLTHLPHELSGGQQQRVAIARALIAKPDIIFADEPTGNLDSKSGGEVMEMLQSIWKKMGKTLVIITHDSRIARMADRQFVIVDGVLSEVTAR